MLTNHFRDQCSSETNSARFELDANSIDSLLAHPWPGNVRELKQTILRAATMADDTVIHPFDLGLAATNPTNDENPFRQYLGMPLSEAKTQAVESLERSLIAAAMDRSEGNISEAARQLGIHRQSLQQKLAQLGLR